MPFALTAYGRCRYCRYRDKKQRKLKYQQDVICIYRHPRAVINNAIWVKHVIGGKIQ
ncbi:hypothetical protein Cst_c15390 [Thermoclostridium stercorarium subsp. stercorarium DSM 8532]|uniref:Uncharacterized protein n=1 Tax=Thermoclostridium stercorarium (strain ATCC 35414 / DSM 8532 / NCIMB 11754) TaxID=1121335 RepID=L7VQ18_THES1|nr:hypothetical protein Cst_c15390 [Thermoclostridium stercorarium subsp. stercorarium DSM 8532]